VRRGNHGVTRFNKTLERLHSRFSERNFAFDDLRFMLLSLGFAERIRGSHHIFTRDGVDEIVNLQAVGRLAKPYQVRQVRAIILRYGLGGGRRDE
jgi:hypothetical protein